MSSSESRTPIFADNQFYQFLFNYVTMTLLSCFSWKASQPRQEFITYTTKLSQLTNTRVLVTGSPSTTAPEVGALDVHPCPKEGTHCLHTSIEERPIVFHPCQQNGHYFTIPYLKKGQHFPTRDRQSTAVWVQSAHSDTFFQTLFSFSPPVSAPLAGCQPTTFVFNVTVPRNICV